MNLLPWIFGILGMLANFLVYQQKERKNLLLAKMTADFLWAIHYASLFAWSGTVLCGIAFSRSVVFLNEGKKWATRKIWLVVFLILGIGLNLATWKNAFCIFPCVAGILAVVSFWQSKPIVSKILAYPISLCMIIYDFSCHSVMGLVSESIVLTSCTISLVSKKVKKSEKNKP